MIRLMNILPDYPVVSNNVSELLVLSLYILKRYFLMNLLLLWILN